jgi:hypothetical protein
MCLNKQLRKSQRRVDKSPDTKPTSTRQEKTQQRKLRLRMLTLSAAATTPFQSSTYRGKRKKRNISIQFSFVKKLKKNTCLLSYYYAAIVNM